MKSTVVVLLLAIVALAALSVWQRSLRSTEEPIVSLDSKRTGTAPSAQPAAEARPAPPRGPLAPDILSDTWLNSASLAPADLRGKVVLVEFWTYG